MKKKIIVVGIIFLALGGVVGCEYGVIPKNYVAYFLIGCFVYFITNDIRKKIEEHNSK